jgi:hypothetical protein
MMMMKRIKTREFVNIQIMPKYILRTIFLSKR